MENQENVSSNLLVHERERSYGVASKNRLSLAYKPAKAVLGERNGARQQPTLLKRKHTDRDSFASSSRPTTSLINRNLDAASFAVPTKRRRESSSVSGGSFASQRSALAALEKVLGPLSQPSGRESRAKSSVLIPKKGATSKKTRSTHPYPSPSSSFSSNNTSRSFQQNGSSITEPSPKRRSVVTPPAKANAAQSAAVTRKDAAFKPVSASVAKTTIVNPASKEYESDFIEFLRSQEPLYAPNGSQTVDLQTDITWQNRATLVNWMAALHYRHSRGKSSAAYYSAVNILDRFMQNTFISLSRFHLAGVAALLIASKLEDLEPLTAELLTKATGYTVAKSWILAAEKAILDSIAWRLNVPQPADFIALIAQVDLADCALACNVGAVVNMSHFIVEVSLLEETFFECPFSLRASGAYYLALAVFQQLPVKGYPTEWSSKHTETANYPQKTIFQLSKALIQALIKFYVPVPSTKALVTNKAFEELDCPGALWRKYADYESFPCVNKLGPSKLVERVLKYNNYV